MNNVGYSQSIDDLEEKKVESVQYTDGDYSALYTLKGGEDNVAYQCTVMPNDSGLTDRIVDAGATLEVIIPNNDASIWTYYLHMTLVLPLLIFAFIGWWLNRRMKKAMGDDGPSMNFGSGGFGGGMGGGLGKSGAHRGFERRGRHVQGRRGPGGGQGVGSRRSSTSLRTRSATRTSVRGCRAAPCS